MSPGLHRSTHLLHEHRGCRIHACLVVVAGMAADATGTQPVHMGSSGSVERRRGAGARRATATTALQHTGSIQTQ